MRIVLLGKDGQVGRELLHALTTLGDVISFGRADLDLAASRSIDATLMVLKPDVIINASAYTEVDRAESEIGIATLVNAVAPGRMADAARKTGAVFVHYSTDYVFDGAKNFPYVEGDSTNPLNAYGKSKREGEINIQQAGGAYLILRTSWVYSMRRNGFVNKVLQWSRNNTTLRIVEDQISNPTWARALAEITATLLAQNQVDLFDAIRAKYGIYHLAGTGYASRYKWAKEILVNASKRTGQPTPTLVPVSSGEFPTPARRPLFTALDCTKFESTFGLRLPGWKDSLQTAMFEESAHSQ